LRGSSFDRSNSNDQSSKVNNKKKQEQTEIRKGALYILRPSGPPNTIPRHETEDARALPVVPECWMVQKNPKRLRRDNWNARDLTRPRSNGMEEEKVGENAST